MPDRFSEVTKKLYRGGRPSPKELGMLKDLWGIKKIVSLDEESGKAIKPTCKNLGLEHIIWGLGDGTDPKVAALKSHIIPTLTLGGPTYVHCYHGKDRTGMTVAMFRVLSGWSVGDALAEAFKFGMGKGLSPVVKKSYYDAVKQFAKELKGDRGDAEDVVSRSRSENSFGPTGTGWDDMTMSRQDRSWLPPHADPERGEGLSRIASERVYCQCKPSNLLKPNVSWWGTKMQAKMHPKDADGQLFSANISSGAMVERFDKPANENLRRQVLVRPIDIAALRNEEYVVLVPNSLVSITEEDDVNNGMDFGMVGSWDRSTDGLYSIPGSGSGVGGMPDGAAGVVQLPFSGPGQV
jgi:hypothetical protein